MNYTEYRDREWNEGTPPFTEGIKETHELKPSFNFEICNIQKSENVTCFFSISIGWWQAFKPWINIELWDCTVLNIGWFPEVKERK